MTTFYAVLYKINAEDADSDKDIFYLSRKTPENNLGGVIREYEVNKLQYMDIGRVVDNYTGSESDLVKILNNMLNLKPEPAKQLSLIP